MIFVQILETFRGFVIDVLPLFIIALVLSAVVVEYFPARGLDKLLQQMKNRETLVSALLGVVIPATPAFRVSMAAIARRSGAQWTPVLTFVAGAGAGLATLIMTSMVSIQFMILRLVVVLLFAYAVSLFIVKLIEPRLAAVAMDSDVETLFSRDFSEVSAEDIDNTGGSVTLAGVWRNLLGLARVMLPWLFLSLFLATLVDVVVPKATVEALLGGRFSALKAALIGIPFYFVGGAEIPLLNVLVNKGMNLGAAVSLMLTAPLINFPVLSVLGRWVGYRKALGFMAMCWFIAVAIGLLLGYVDVK